MRLGDLGRPVGHTDRRVLRRLRWAKVTDVPERALRRLGLIMTNHTWGVDKSHFDAPGGTATIVSQGFGFMTHKAGGDANDGELNAWWNDAKGHRDDLLLGAYWVLYPGHGASAGDAFLARLDSQCPGWRDGPFILQLDCEEWQSDPSTMPRLGDIRACALRLRALMPKLVPIVYAPHWAYGNTLSGLGFPLWSSSYTTAKGTASAIYPGDSYSGWASYSGIVPAIAQFSSTATVAGDSTTDVNCFKGTQAELSALLAPGWGLDMTTVDLTQGALDAIAARLFGLSKQSDGTPTSTAGNMWNQGIPNPFHPELPAPHRTVAWQLLEDLATAVVKLQADVASVKANPATVDTVALAAALAPQITGMTQAEIEAALEAAVRDLVHPPPAAEGEFLETPVHDATADDFTRRARQERQPGIQ